MIIALDCETTGVDLRHGARPFLITTCDEQGDNTYWEFFVDPETREPIYNDHDLDEIRQTIASADEIVLQNGKFDATALQLAGIVKDWDWSKCHDTLIAGHLLASNKPHNLTDMCLSYLGPKFNIEPFEQAVKEATNEARRMARRELPTWLLAKEDLPCMPSAKSGTKKDKKGLESESPWKFDMWLPRALALVLDYPDDHPWWTVCRDYANADSAVTMKLWPVMARQIKADKLWEIYKTRMWLPEIACEMESTSVTIKASELESIRTEYIEEIERYNDHCRAIAATYEYDLQLPKGGRNKSLDTFVWDVLGLEKIYQEGGKTQGPSLDAKVAIPHYMNTLAKDSDGYQFIKSLVSSRKRSTAVGYLDTYKKFWLPLEGHDDYYKLYASINPTGTSLLRSSMSNPNLQQVSKQESLCEECKGEGCDECNGTGEDLHSVRRIFGPEPGRVWYTFDAKNLELRFPSYEAGEEEMIALFERGDEAPFYGSNHMLVFSILWEDIWNDALRKVGPEKAAKYCKREYASTYYAWTKNGNFAVQYGAIDRKDGIGTADRAYHQKGAQAKINSRFRKQAKLNESLIAYANKYGYVETMPDMTIGPRGYPLLCTRSEYGKILPTVPLNYHVQGTAGWWMLKAKIRCHKQLKEWSREKFSGRMVIEVHDELVFDFPRPKKPFGDLWRVKTLKRLMEQGGKDLGVPTPVSVEYHPINWATGEVVA